jgi:hypothetical protein
MPGVMHCLKLGYCKQALDLGFYLIFRYRYLQKTLHVKEVAQRPFGQNS